MLSCCFPCMSRYTAEDEEVNERVERDVQLISGTYERRWRSPSTQSSTTLQTAPPVQVSPPPPPQPIPPPPPPQNLVHEISLLSLCPSSKKSVTFFALPEDELENLLFCPVCLAIPEGHVYSCCKGHSVCAKCADKITQCPICRVPFPVGEEKVRNFTLETIINLKRFHCPNKPVGCDKEPMTPDQLLTHQSRCNYGPKAVQLCSLLGLHKQATGPKKQSKLCRHSFVPDSLLEHSSDANRLIDHLTLEHKFRYAEIRFPGTTTCKLTVPSSILFSSSTPTGGLIIRTCEKTGPRSSFTKTLGIYLLLVQISGGGDQDEKNLSLGCVSLNAPHPGREDDPYIQFILKGNPSLQQGPEDFTWEDKCLTVSELTEMITAQEPGKGPNFKVKLPSSLFQEYILGGGGGGEVVPSRMQNTEDGGGLTILVDFSALHNMNIDIVAGVDDNNNCIVEPRKYRTKIAAVFPNSDN